MTFSIPQVPKYDVIVKFPPCLKKKKPNRVNTIYLRNCVSHYSRSCHTVVFSTRQYTGQITLNTTKTNSTLQASCNGTSRLYKYFLNLSTVQFLGVFAKLRKATISFVMSVRLSAWKKWAPTGRRFMKHGI